MPGHSDRAETIKYDDGVIILSFNKTILQNAVTEVCKKLREDFRDIKWVIYDENSIRKKYGKENILATYIVPQGIEYGFCRCNEREIWISTKTLRSSGIERLSSAHLVNKHKNDELLVNVILDELAHIKTGKDHGSKEYDNQLRQYHDRYYSKRKYPLG